MERSNNKLLITDVILKKYLFNSDSSEDTFCVGVELGRVLKKGDLLAINGELGTGKTCLIKGIASGLNSLDIVSSPSFSIIKEYDGNIPIFHFDLYRLNVSEEIEELGYEEYFYGNGVTLIEWASKIQPYLPNELLSINIHFGQEINLRKIYFQPKGKRYRNIMEDLISIANFRN